MGVKVRQKTKGKGNPWWVFVSHNGKRTSRKVGDKKAAEAVASTVRAKLQLGEFGFEDKKPVPTFKEYSQKWLRFVESQCRGGEPKYRESTFEEYEGVLRNHVLPVFKDHRIDSIIKGDVRDFLVSKLDGLSVKRVMLLKCVLSNVFNFALDDELISTNPTTGITKRLFPKNSGKKKTVEKAEVFTKKELNLLLESCEANYKEYHLFFLMAARTGMRLGELLAIRWKDIDLKNNYIMVRQSRRRGRYTKPKNGKSRKVDMSNQLADALREKLRHGFKDVNELVFRYVPTNRQNFIRNLYRRILKNAKLRYIKFHGLRHTFCAHLLSEGVSPYYVSQQSGHSSINITCDIYGSWIRSEENRHVNLLDPMLPSAPPLHSGESEKSQPFEYVANSLI
jgi:integrase